MKCNKCNKSAVFGGGENARCFEHLNEDLKGTNYRDYHTPVKKNKRIEVVDTRQEK